MRIFLTLVGTLILTTILVMFGLDTRRLDASVSQAIRSGDRIQWDIVRGGQVTPHDGTDDFPANTVYTTMMDDDLLVVTWSAGDETYTAPMTNTGDYEFTMQEFSGYVFQSFNPLGRYVLDGDFYDVTIEGMGSWAWLSGDERVTLVNLSTLISVDTDAAEHVILLPGEKIILDKYDLTSGLTKLTTDEKDLQSMFGSDSNQIDTTAYAWFKEKVQQIYTTQLLEYQSWTERERITDVSEEFVPGGLFFFNKRKETLVKIEELFDDIQKLLKTGVDCSTGACKEKTLKSDIDGLTFSEPGVMTDFQNLLETYYQRHVINMMSEDELTNRDTFTYLMYAIYGYEKSHLQEALGSLSQLYEYIEWFSDGKDDQKRLERVFLEMDVTSMRIQDIESVWLYLRRQFQNTKKASEYAIQLMQKYMDIGDIIMRTEGANYTRDQIRETYIDLLAQLRDQIQEGYFTKEGILYVVKPGLIPNADEELDFDIIDDFQKLFERVQEVFADYEGDGSTIKIDKKDQLETILARLRWFECIFSKNPIYMKEPRICRGRLVE